MLSRGFSLFTRKFVISCRRGMTTTRQFLDIGGVYPPIATPFDAEENILYDKLESNLKLWNNAPFKGLLFACSLQRYPSTPMLRIHIHVPGYVVQGSNGEYVYLTKDERIQMVEHVRKFVPKEKLIIAGSGCESTRETVEMTKQMAEVGADAVLVTTPCFYKNGMTNDAMIAHFLKVADSSPVPVILYSVPSNTGIDLAPEVIIKLSNHPNIIGLKDSGGDISKIGNLVFKTKQRGFQILAGSASFLYPSIALGCVGGVCALANVLPQEVCRLYELSRTGRHSEAQSLQQRLIAPNAAVTRKFGVPGLKHAMDWFGFYGGPTRSPLQALTSDEETSVRQMFAGSGYQGPQP